MAPHSGECSLCQGSSIFLPQDEASAPLLEQPPNPRGTFELCRQGIDACEVVLAVADGPDADSGTAWCGCAYAHRKPIVALRTDCRGGGEDYGLNLMLRRSAAAVVHHPGDELSQLIKVSTSRSPGKVRAPAEGPRDGCGRETVRDDRGERTTPNDPPVPLRLPNPVAWWARA
jgi:hypothetical protein